MVNRNWEWKEMRMKTLGDVKVQQAPISLSASGKSFIPRVSVAHVLYSLVLSRSSCFLNIYKHNYGAIVLGQTGCREDSELRFLFWTKAYFGIASSPPNILPDHTLKFLDLMRISVMYNSHTTPAWRYHCMVSHSSLASEARHVSTTPRLASLNQTLPNHSPGILWRWTG